MGGMVCGFVVGVALAFHVFLEVMLATAHK
jgi:hypothetical protein